VGQAFGLSDVVVRIAHNVGLENITTRRNLPFVRHPNSIAVIFTHITDQSTQHTRWVPLVPFLFRNVHIIFCAKNTQMSTSCIRSSSLFLRHLTFHWCRSRTVEYVYRSTTGLSPQFFRQSTGVKHRASALHNCTTFFLCSTVLFGSSWHGESVRNTVFFKHFLYSFRVEFLTTVREQNFCDVSSSLYFFQKLLWAVRHLNFMW